ncbi:MAG: isoprenylcysteine carboxylmethyltransferase family protein [Methanocellales archaeon]|nr:isoprenylcysteine carboxylmethyltransferase family protein [Methanocellales archaeon]MDD3291996.1 isoprenylcysteine carboxylmethyltransferase family protein [Methanocellales archaeon]MDD5235892.1 isoprenylcysteine carboxylmethyltransferase family protein [Methanocellales archaeon]MDD5485449.1 isoprenylcysteine carboxylmethyltransferase family protein [Methanocellales archaeon]
MISISNGLGSEHPLCDKIQLIMIILFFVVWGTDTISFFTFGYSTVLVGLISLPMLILPASVFLGLSLYLISKSHNVVLGGTKDNQQLLDSGVYAWVRHPMYLGTLLFCLGFFFLSPSLISLGIWMAFFIIYDKMATYEENDLVKILGKDYESYQNRVSKWLPIMRIRSKQSMKYD